MAKPKTIGGMSPGEIKVLRFLRKYITAKGYSPSYSEIGVATGYASKDSISNILKHLETGALIKRSPGKHKGLQVTEAGLAVHLPPEPRRG